MWRVCIIKLAVDQLPVYLYLYLYLEIINTNFYKCFTNLQMLFALCRLRLNISRAKVRSGKIVIIISSVLSNDTVCWNNRSVQIVFILKNTIHKVHSIHTVNFIFLKGGPKFCFIVELFQIDKKKKLACVYTFMRNWTFQSTFQDIEVQSWPFAFPK